MAISTAAAILGGAAIGIGGSILGSGKAADAAENAANTQAASADAATQAQWDMYNQSREDYSPFRDIGVNSLSDLARLSGQSTREFDQAAYDKAVAASPSRNDMSGEDFAANQNLYENDPKYKEAYDKVWAEHLDKSGTTPAAYKGSDINVWKQQIAEAYGGTGQEPNKEDFYKTTPGEDPFATENAMLQQWEKNKYDYGSESLNTLGEMAGRAINPTVNVDLSGQRAITSRVGSMNTAAAQDLTGQRDLTGRLADINPLAAQNYDRAQGFIGQAEALNPNITFDENSPYFQASKNELMRTLNNRMSAQGLSGSSTSEDAIIRNILPLIEQEYGRQEGNYTRSLGQFGQLYGMETGLGGIRYGETAGDITRQAGLLGQQYTQTSGTDQMGYTQSAGDIERDLSRLEKLFGLQSSTDTTQYNVDAANYARAAAEAQRQFGNTTTLYGAQQGYDQDYFNRGAQVVGLENLVNQQGYNRQLDLAKIGAGAAAQSGSAALQTGANVGNIQQASGAAIAQGQLAAGQQQANMYSNLGSIPLQAYGQYQIGQYLNK